MTPPFVDDPNHWRIRASHVRELAEAMTDPASKAAMFRISEDYERLAARAEQRVKMPPQSK
jgi:hypothetical protein